jgi:hypothetical protein
MFECDEEEYGFIGCDAVQSGINFIHNEDTNYKC